MTQSSVDFPVKNCRRQAIDRDSLGLVEAAHVVNVNRHRAVPHILT